MRLIMLHGRHDPEEDMEDWGFDGPDLEGTTAMHVTYMSTFNLWFESHAAAKKAQELTGWNWWDEDALEMEFVDGLLYIHPEGQKPTYYGDWELQIRTPNGESV